MNRQYPKTVIGLGVLAASIALGGTAHAATTAPAAAKAHPTCRAQAKTWAAGPAKHQLAAIQTDLKAFGGTLQKFAVDLNKGGATKSDVAAVRSSAAALRTAAGKVGANPGPACIAGLRADLTAAAADYSKAGLEAQDAMTKYSKGSQDAAASDFKVVSTEITQGGKKMTAANTAVSKYTGK